MDVQLEAPYQQKEILLLLLLFSYSCLFHVFPYCVYKIETEIMQDFKFSNLNLNYRIIKVNI